MRRARTRTVKGEIVSVKAVSLTARENERDTGLRQGREAEERPAHDRPKNSCQE